MPQDLYDKATNESHQRLDKFFGELELAVMEIVWGHTWVNVRDVLGVLKREGRPLAYTTVMTVMSRLNDKGWLVVEKRGRAYYYRAAYARAETEATAVGEVVRALLHDFGDVAVAQFVKELDEIDPDHLSRLAALIQGVEHGKDDAQG